MILIKCQFKVLQAFHQYCSLSDRISLCLIFFFFSPIVISAWLVGIQFLSSPDPSLFLKTIFIATMDVHSGIICWTYAFFHNIDAELFCY